jgi:hypothetical protein
MLIHGPADSTTLGLVSRWCELHDVLPQTLVLGQRNLEDVFLELTGRELESTPRRSSSPPLRSSAEQRRGDPA